MTQMYNFDKQSAINNQQNRPQEAVPKMSVLSNVKRERES